MNVLDFIIQNREQILYLASKHGVITLKLYGSVLVRKEREDSDIDLLAIFDPHGLYHWQTIYDLQQELEAYFGRRVGVLDARRIPDVFRPAVDNDPVDILELSSDTNYTITPKTSRLYFIMLDRMFKKYFPIPDQNRECFYELVADKLSWWFSRLLRITDNDLKDYSGFNYVEVITLCEKISAASIEKYVSEDLKRFEELLNKVKAYVELRLKEGS